MIIILIIEYKYAGGKYLGLDGDKYVLKMEFLERGQ